MEGDWVRTAVELDDRNLSRDLFCGISVPLVIKDACLQIKSLNNCRLPENLLGQRLIVFLKNLVLRCHMLQLGIKFISPPNNGIKVEVRLAEYPHLIVA